MAYCGTMTLHDKTGAGRYTIRYGCMPEGDIVGLRDRLVADVATLRSKRPDLKIELLCDGAPEMWNLLEEGFTPKFGNDLERFVDFITPRKSSALQRMCWRTRRLRPANGWEAGSKPYSTAAAQQPTFSRN